MRATPAGLFAGLLAVFLLEYLRPGDFIPLVEAVKLNTLVPLGVAALTIGAAGGRPNAQVLRAPDTKLFLVLVAMFFIQLFTADVRLYVFENFKGFLGYLLLYYVLIRQVTTLRRLRAVMATLVLVHVVTVALHPAVILNPETRHYLGGTFLSDGNDFAWSTCVVLPYALFLASTSDRPVMKVVFYALFALLVMAVIGTQSRGSSLALLASIFYLAMKSRKKGLALGGMALLVAVVAAFAPPAYFQRIDTISDWRTEGSAQGRILAWQSATLMALDHPIVGVGSGHYGVKFGFEYKPRGYHGPYLNTHSIYFVMLAEFGFPGLIVLLSMIIGNWLRNSRLLRHLSKPGARPDVLGGRLIDTMQASLIGFAVAAAFLSGVFYPHLFVVTALMSVARYIAAANARPGPGPERELNPRSALSSGAPR